MTKKAGSEQHLDTHAISSIFELEIHSGSTGLIQTSSSPAARTLEKNQIWKRPKCSKRVSTKSTPRKTRMSSTSTP